MGSLSFLCFSRVTGSLLDFQVLLKLYAFCGRFLIPLQDFPKVSEVYGPQTLSKTFSVYSSSTDSTLVIQVYIKPGFSALYPRLVR